MSLFRDVQLFTDLCNRVSTLEELQALLQDAVRFLGFDYVALVQHFAVGEPRTRTLQLGDYPEAWKEMITERGWFADDPVLMACQTSASGFTWSEVPQRIALNARQRLILDSAKDAGLGEGFTVPVSVPGDIMGSCSFGVRLGRNFPAQSMPAAQWVGCFGFEAVRRIKNLDDLRSGPRLVAKPKLTSRQLDCVVLVAQGKSDWDIAQLLGISDQTVHQHIEDAKRRHGVASRTQLVVRALFENQLNFADILH